LVGGLLFAQHYLLAHQTQEPLQLLIALASEASNQTLMRGHEGEGRALLLLAEMDGIAARLDTPYARAIALAARSTTVLWLGDFARAGALAAESDRILRENCTGVSWERSFAASVGYGSMQFTGGLAVIEAEAPLRAREAADNDDEHSKQLMLLSIRLIHLMKDEPEQALALIMQQMSTLPPDYTAARQWVMMTLAESLIYSGQGAAALEHVNRAWPAFQRSYLRRMPFFEADARCTRARSALAAADGSSDPRLLELAASEIRRVRSLQTPSTTARARLIEAELSARRGRHIAARYLLEEAERNFRALGMSLYATYARHARGQLQGGDDGHALRAEAEASLRAEGIVNPARWAAAFAPRVGRDRAQSA
jgi:hypothetical protein